MWKNAANENLETDILTMKPELGMLILFLTQECNCKCKMCHQWGEKGWNYTREGQKRLQESLSLENVLNFFDQAKARTGKFNLLLTGGEAFLHPEIYGLFEALESYTNLTGLITNGLLINKNSDILKKQQNMMIIASLDGPPEVHNSIRGVKDLFENVCTGLEEIIRYKQKTNALFPLVEINYTLSEFSYTTFEDFINVLESRFAKKGVKFVYDLPDFANLGQYGPEHMFLNISPRWFVHNQNGIEYEKQMKELFNLEVSSKWKSFLLEEKTAAEIAGDMKNICDRFYNERNYGDRNFIDMEEYHANHKNVFGHTRCTSPWKNLVVQSSGDAYFCSDFNDYSLGNIKETSFEEIWLGEKAKKFREVLQKQLLPVCNRCCNLV